MDYDKFGRMTQHDLKPNGQDIPVTDENKKEYVHLYVQWRFRVGVEKQFMAVQKGFHELIPPHLLKQFDEKELELIVSGLGSVDVNDWKSNTRLKNCTPETDVIQWFWKVSWVVNCCTVIGLPAMTFIVMTEEVLCVHVLNHDCVFIT